MDENTSAKSKLGHVMLEPTPWEWKLAHTVCKRLRDEEGLADQVRHIVRCILIDELIKMRSTHP